MGLGCQSGHKVVLNGLPGNYCKVSNEHIIGHVLGGQNEESTLGSVDSSTAPWYVHAPYDRSIVASNLAWSNQS